MSGRGRRRPNLEPAFARARVTVWLTRRAGPMPCAMTLVAARPALLRQCHTGKSNAAQMLSKV
jgi:hypothetical protein